MWEDSADIYNKLEDNIEANRSLKASFFQGGGNMTALAATLIYGYLIATLQALYSLYTAYAMSLD